MANYELVFQLPSINYESAIIIFASLSLVYLGTRFFAKRKKGATLISYHRWPSVTPVLLEGFWDKSKIMEKYGTDQLTYLSSKKILIYTALCFLISFLIFILLFFEIKSI